MRFFRRSAASSSRRRSSTAQRRPELRHFHPSVECLEVRLALAGLFTENFSGDLAADFPGFDSWDNDAGTAVPDAIHIQNDLPGQGATQGFFQGGRFDILEGQPGLAGWGLFADGHVLRVLSFGGTAAVTFRVPPPGTAGGLAAGEGVTGAGVSVLGMGVVQIFGANGTLTTPFENGLVWQRVVADRDDLLPGGLELGEISHVTVFTHHEGRMSLDELSLQVSQIEQNQPPQAADDTILVDRRFGDSVVFYPLANDFDANGDSFELVSYTQPSRGALDQLQGGFRYRASDELLNDRTIRDDSFTYTIQDSQGATASATVHIVLNRQPLGQASLFEQPHGTSGPFVVGAPGLRAGLIDPDGDSLTLRVGIAPAHGDVIIRPDGSFTYTPEAADGRVVPDVFWYIASDGYENSDLVRVDIRHANSAPLAADQVIDVDHGTPGPLQGVLFFSDPDGDLVNLTVIDPSPEPSNSFFRTDRGTFILNDGQSLELLSGDVQFDYFPQTGDLRASDQFTFRVTDGYGGSATATLQVRVPNYRPEVVIPAGQVNLTQVRGLSVARPDGNLPATGELFASGDAGAYSFVRSDLQILAIDLDHDPLTAVLADRALHGQVVLQPDGQFTYTPHPDSGLFGTDTFSYRLSDGVEWSSDVIYVTIRQTLGEGDARSDIFQTVDYDPSGPNTSRPDRIQINPRQLLANDVLSSGWAPSAIVRGLEIDDSSGLYAADETFVYHLTEDGEPGAFIDEASPYISIDEVFGVTARVSVDPGESALASFRYRFLFSPPGLPAAALWTDLVPSSWATVAINVSDDPQGDSDGVYDAVEQTAGHRDGNSDGVDDAVQPHVATLPVPTGTGPHAGQAWMTLVAGGSTTLTGVKPMEITSSTPPAPSGVQFPLGLVEFRVLGLLDGEATTVTLIPHGNFYLSTYYKFGREPVDDPATPGLDEVHQDHWYEFLYDPTTGAPGAEIINERDILGFTVTTRIVLHLADGQRGDHDRFGPGVIHDPGGPAVVQLAPRVASVTVNDGASQRSMVTQLDVTFTEPVTVDAGAFDLRKVGAKKPIDVKVVTSTVDGRTVAHLTFKNGRDVTAGSLRDGDYRLTIRGDKVRDADGNLLDGDEDGSLGGNYVDEFFRRFGDTDGDDDVDLLDAEVFASTLGKRSRDDGYLWYLDWNANGKVWKEDLALFLLGYCRSNKRR